MKDQGASVLASALRREPIRTVSTLTSAETSYVCSMSLWYAVSLPFLAAAVCMVESLQYFRDGASTLTMD